MIPKGASLVVALAQLLQLSPVQGGVPAGTGFFHGLERLAQDADHVPGPGLQAAGPSLVTARHLPMTCDRDSSSPCRAITSARPGSSGAGHKHAQPELKVSNTRQRRRAAQGTAP